MKRFLLTILTIAIVVCTSADAMAARPKRSSKSVKKERRLTAGELEKTRKQISQNDAETRRQLNKLQTLNAQTKRSEQAIIRLQNHIDSIDYRIKVLDDSIKTMEQNLTTMRNTFADNLRKSRARRQTMNEMAVIFSSSSFTEAYRRYRYLQEFERWQIQKTVKIKDLAAKVAIRRETAAQSRKEQAKALAELTAENKRLEATKADTETVVKNLKKRGSSLKTVLEQKQKQLKELDDELNRIIAEEARIAAEEAEKAEKARLAEEARRKAEEAREAKTDSKSYEKKDKKAKKQKPDKTDSGSKTVRPKAKEVIANEHQAPSSDKIIVLNGSFEANKGRMPFPVEGHSNIVSHFGLNSHRDVSNVKINNSGIDIETQPGAKARAVFDGEVSSVFRVSGYHNVVMLRHGAYLTVYAGIDNLSVKKGDTVKAGQTIGTIFSDPDDDNRSILHFELRRERKKLNPEEWLR